MKLRVSFLIGLASLLVIPNLGCHTHESRENIAQVSKSPKIIRIASFSTAIDYSPYLIARSQGWFEEAFRQLGSKVEYTTFETLPSVDEALGSDRVDAVFEAGPQAIIAKAAGIHVQVIGISASFDNEIVVPTKSSIHSFADLRGKKIAVLAGTSSHYGLLKLERIDGMPDGSIRVIDMRPPDAKSAFETGNVDAWAVWPPWGEQETLSGKARILVRSDAQSQSILTVRDDFANEYPAAVCALSSTLERAKQWIQDNPRSAMKIVAEEMNLPLKVVELAWPEHNWKVQLSGPIRSDLQEKADFLKARGLITKAVSVDSTFVHQPVCPSH